MVVMCEVLCEYLVGIISSNPQNNPTREALLSSFLDENTETREDYVSCVTSQFIEDAGGIQTPMFTAGLFTIAKTWKQPKCSSTEEWIKKMWYIHTMEYYSAIKKNEIMPFAATWIGLDIIILSEVSRTEKDKYHIISLICGI